MEKDDPRTMQPLNANMTEPIPRFSGDDMTYSSSKWAQDIEDNSEIFGWSAQQKLIIARRSLSGTAELWLRTEKTFRTYEELKAALQKEFPDAINSKQMHEIMAARKKQSGESYYQYMLTMKELGKRAKFPDYVSIQYIVDGIMDCEQNKIGLYGITTYPALKERLTLYEAMKQKMKQRGSQGVSKPRESRKPFKVSDHDVQNVNDRPVHRCFNCGEKGHIASTCSKGLKCFKCNNFGHMATACRAENIQKPNEAGSTGSRNARNVGSTTGGSGANIRSRRSSMFVREQRTDNAGIVNDSGIDNIDQVNSEVSNVRSVVECHSCHCQNNLNQNILNVNNNNATFNRSIKIVKIGDISVKCLVDTGSDVNLISYDLFSMLSDVNDCVPEKLALSGLGKSQVFSIGKFAYNLIIDGHCYSVFLHIVPKGVIPYPIILGQTFLVHTVTLIDKGIVKIKPYSYDSSFLQCLPTNV